MNMFKRKIYNEILKWKTSLKTNRKALVIKGLRQVGKTTTILEFAKDNYKNFVYINFKTQQEIKKAFQGDLSVDNIILNLSALNYGFKFIPHETLIIFDEIQECNAARTSLKSFCEMDDRFDVIASGSLLGLKGYNPNYRGGASIGYESFLELKAMDFEEFLWAINFDNKVIDYVKSCFRTKSKINVSVHESLKRIFKQYLVVGGMPKVVDVFLKTQDFFHVRKEQLDILKSYEDDYGKHLDAKENEVLNTTLLNRISKVFNSIPIQLAKENKKFMYSVLGKNARGSLYLEAIEWLKDYGLITLCKNIKTIDEPLKGQIIDDNFKIYVADSGLFFAMLEDDAVRSLYLDEMGIYKGAIYENIVADAFYKNDIDLYYFSKDSGLEIDFITNYLNKLMLVEVKAKSGRTKAASTILNDKIKYPNVKGLLKLGDYNIGQENEILTLPYYLAFLIKGERFNYFELLGNIDIKMSDDIS